MRVWTVAGAVLERGEELLLVCNRRRNGRLDWSTPGGVVDEGETVLEALGREVVEETGIEVLEWSAPLYEVDVLADDLQWHMRAVVHQAESWVGDLDVADPDGIVIDADFVDAARRDRCLVTSPPWVREPLIDWIETRPATVEVYRYEVDGSDLSSLIVRRV